MMKKGRRLSWLIFATAFIAFAYFQQGGGWNQNARFAMVRAMVEQRKLSIDSYLIYVRAKPDPSSELNRLEVSNAEYETGSHKNLLMWKTSAGQLLPVNSTLEGIVAAVDISTKAIEVQDIYRNRVRIAVSDKTEIRLGSTPADLSMISVGASIAVSCAWDQRGLEAKLIDLQRDLSYCAFTELGSVAATGDLAFYHGHFYPNKAPGTSFVAMPAYWLLYHWDQIIGAHPDDWWTLTLNAWLTSVFSVGVISALGVPLFYRVAYRFSGGRSRTSLIAAGLFAFGTMFFPYSTLLYEHNIIAVALLAAFYLLYRAKCAQLDSQTGGLTNPGPAPTVFLAGLCAGWAAITNYIFLIAVIFLAGYALLCLRKKADWIWFALGLLGPFLLICAYNTASFDTPFTTNYENQNPDFMGGTNRFLHVFNYPRWDVLLTILFSPFRGLFFTAPILLIAIVGLVAWLCDPKFRAEGMLISGIFVSCVLFNISFNGWDGGYTAVPRYLGPAIPFLSLATLGGLTRCFKTTCLFGIISILMMFVITAVDPEPPIGVGTGPGVVLDRPQWQYNPFGEYDLPIFIARRPLPLLRQQKARVLDYYDRQLANEGWTESARNEERERIRHEIDRQITAGEPAYLVLARAPNTHDDEYLIAKSYLSVPGRPVSTHDFGYYGYWAEGQFGAAGSMQSRWNSFNVGEFLFPESRWSLLPLLIVAGFLSWRSVLIARQLDRAHVLDYKSGPTSRK